MRFIKNENGFLQPDPNTKPKMTTNKLIATGITGLLVVLANVFIMRSASAHPLEVFALQTIGAFNMMFVVYYLNVLCQSGD